MHTTDDTGNGALIDRWISRIPGLVGVLEQAQSAADLDEGRKARELGRSMVLASVAKTLNQTDDADTVDGEATEWMSELAEFNYDNSKDADTVDGEAREWMLELAEFNYDDSKDAEEFITTLVWDRAIEWPWIIEAPFMRRVAHFSTKSHEIPLRPKYPSLCETNSHCRSLYDVVGHHGGGPTAKGTMAVTFPRVTISEDDSNSLAFDLDCHLGIAGVVPFNAPESKTRFLSEFLGQVQLEPLKPSGLLARVSFRPSAGRPDAASGRADDPYSGMSGSIERLLKPITAMVFRLERALAQCQASGRCRLGIPFLKHDQRRKDVVLLKMLEFPDIDLFFQAFGRFHITYLSRSFSKYQPALPEASSQQDPTSHWGSGKGLPSWDSYSSSPSALQSPQSALFGLGACVRLLMQTLGFELVANTSKTDTYGVLHLCALAVQFMSLAIRSSARGLTGPLDFSFLESQVTQFMLEGTVGLAITANLRNLSCFGDMLGQPVLVFGEVTMGESLGKADLVASVEHLLSVWGPGEVKLVQVSAADYRIDRIMIGGGRLRPTILEKSDQMWHWEPDHPSATKPSPPESNMIKQSTVRLEDVIRIGVLETPPSGGVQILGDLPADIPTLALRSKPSSLERFTPIGPSHNNTECPHSREEVHSRRRESMVGFLKELGTHAAYTSVAGHDLTVQAGSYVLLEGTRRWDRRPATVVKDVLLDGGQSLTELMKRLDTPCGLFISSCTKIMSRARLRDLVAFAGPLLRPESFPQLGGLSRKDSLAALVQALQGDDDFAAWASAKSDAAGCPLTHSSPLKDLILGVVRTLKPTGVTPTGQFEAAWISQRHPTQAVAVPCSENPWLYLFQDSPLAATFACVTPLCLETVYHCCPLRRLAIPAASLYNPDCSLRLGVGDFALSTRLLPYRNLPGCRQPAPGEPEELKVGCSYFMNYTAREVVAYVYRADGWGYLTKVKEARKAPGVLLRRLITRGDIRFVRESTDTSATRCLISSSEIQG